MPYTNEVRLMGVLAEAPELSCSERGEAFCSLIVLVREGDQVERIPVEVSGQYAEEMLETTDIGSLVLIEGKLVGGKNFQPNPRLKVIASRAWDIVAFTPGDDLPTDLLAELPKE